MSNDNTQTRRMTFHLLDNQGRPISGAAIETAFVPVGACRQDCSTEKYSTDANGSASVDIPMVPLSQFVLRARKPGLVPKVANWFFGQYNKELTAPDSFTMQLEPGISVGGLVIDENGQPIQGAKVEFYINSRLRDYSLPSFICPPYETMTDVNGQWHLEDIPTDFDNFHVKVIHADFVSPLRPGVDEVTADQLRSNTAKLILKRGLTLSGYVFDDHGKAVTNARIVFHTPQRCDWHPILSTDDRGFYQCKGMEPLTHTVAVTSPDWAPQMHTADVSKGPVNLDFHLKHGKQISGIVVDKEGMPLSDVYVAINPDETNNFVFICMQTDATGRFTWSNAPDRPLQFSICKKGFAAVNNFTMSPSQKDYRIVLLPALRISGTVIDADTLEPLSAFLAIPGVQQILEHERPYTDWLPPLYTERCANGHFELTFDVISDKYVVKIEAAGYKPQISQPFDAAQENVTIDFKLKKASDFSATVHTPSGSVAANAQVVVNNRSIPLNVHKGVADHFYDLITRVTDADGCFSIPPIAEEFMIFISHESGYAVVNGMDLPQIFTVTLQEWATLQGIAKSGSKPVINGKICLGYRAEDKNKPCIVSYSETDTDDNGHFRFDRLIAGSASLWRRMSVNEPIINLKNYVEISSGSHLDVGVVGGGRTLIGKLLVPPGCEPDILTKYVAGGFLFNPAISNIPYPEGFDNLSEGQQMDWFQEFAKTPEGRELLTDSGTEIHIKVAPDATFRGENTSAGDYIIKIFVVEKPGDCKPDRCNVPKVVAHARFAITVPEALPEEVDVPFNLGEVQLIRGGSFFRL